ncbi:hypothetical protein LDBUL1519_00819 [Lactobacillus delbrueckii subsp. bulgaricus CNCM I-1519]|nr:hypothetical protein LDBUL1519_00819 [Lactobacillus delbrueckii subsp. bulgaricus CNCM I-1519]QDH98058.1 hypothetical protein FG480_09655 [Lactobacillus delbrueckii subsp. bulgaricus]
MKYTITAATGHLGREVVKELNKLTDVKNIRLAVRSPQKAADLAEAGYEVIHSDYYDVPKPESSTWLTSASWLTRPIIPSRWQQAITPTCQPV